uniref:Fucose kinase n=1 Tax=Fundulus heteroclitus TaxID=8078 RepID=A0A3Q2QVR9_FUNHE
PGQKVQAPVCVLDLLLDRLSTQFQICPGSPPGVWVCSTDMILTVPGFSGVRVLAVPGDVSYAADHGVYLADSQGRVRDIIYRGSREQIQRALMPDGKVPLVSGPVFFCRSVSEKLLQTHVSPPLDGCTYLGLDSGAPPLQQISLFLDLLKCLCADLTQDQFVGEDRAGCSSTAGPQGAAVRAGRAELWRILRGAPLSLYIPGGRYDYLTLSGKQQVDRLTSDWTDRNTLSHIQIINSVLDGDVCVATRAVVQHCHLQQGPLDVPSGCLLSGLDISASACIRRLALSNDIIIQGHRIELGELKLNVYTAMGAHDNLQEQCSLLEARLFPVLHPRGGAVGLEGGVGWLLGGPGCLQRWREAWRVSLREVLSLTHQEAELQWREELLFLVGRRRVTDALRSRTDVCLLPCFRAAVQGGQQGALLETLDCGVSARCLSCIADVLVCMAQGKGGLRSGPAANEAWSSAYFLLEEGSLKEGVSALAAQRQHWLSTSSILAGALLAAIYRCTGRTYDTDSLIHAVLYLEQILTTGGWQDQVGGLVGGVKVGRSRASLPLQVEVERLSPPPEFLVSLEQHLLLVYTGKTRLARNLLQPDLLVRAARHYEGAGQVLLRQAVMSSQRFISIGQGEAPPIGEWQEVECPARLDLAGWSDTPPIAFEHGGSVTNIAVKVDGKRPIGARARRIVKPHLLLVSHSGGRGGASMETVCDTLDDLRDYCQPHAPALLKAVCVCSGLVSLSSPRPLEHQLMQSWGSGVELHSWSELPTGSGLDVVRSWYSRLPSMVLNAQQLVSNSEECARACLDSLSRLGRCLDRSWQQKKLMAPGCEPASVRTMMEALRPLVLGQSLAGAGGGGFLYLVTRDPRQQQAVLQQGLGDFSVHSVELDMEGI